MLLREPFVAATVVARDAGHQLLLLGERRTIDLGQEGLSRRTAQRRRQPAAVVNEHLTTLRGAKAKAQVVVFPLVHRDSQISSNRLAVREGISLDRVRQRIFIAN